MKIEFLGTGGFHPTETRHTTCLYLPDAAPDAAFILDAGSAFFRLMDKPLLPRLHLFLTHAHLDHVCGLTYWLDVVHGRECELAVYATATVLETVAQNLFRSSLFPVPLDARLHEINPDETFEVEGVRVSTCEQTHPGTSLCFRFDWNVSNHKSLCFATDTIGDGRNYHLMQECDLLIHERYFKAGQDKIARKTGHSTVEDALRAQKQSGAKKLALMHFNPGAKSHPRDEDAGIAPPETLYPNDGDIVEF
jgi:ribonuclease Z